MPNQKKTFVITPNDGNPPLELQGTRAQPDTAQGSTRVDFYDGDDMVGSFINLRSWHVKAD